MDSAHFHNYLTLLWLFPLPLCYVLYTIMKCHRETASRTEYMYRYDELVGYCT